MTRKPHNAGKSKTEIMLLCYLHIVTDLWLFDGRKTKHTIIFSTITEKEHKDYIFKR